MENSGENPALRSTKLTKVCFKNEQERLDEYAKHLLISQEFTDTLEGLKGEDGADGTPGADGATYTRYEYPIAVGTHVVSTGLTEDQLKRASISLFTTRTPDTVGSYYVYTIAAVHQNGDISAYFWNLGSGAGLNMMAPDNTFTIRVIVFNEDADQT